MLPSGCKGVDVRDEWSTLIPKKPTHALPPQSSRGMRNKLCIETPKTNIKIVPACIHRDFVLGKAITGDGHSIPADNAPGCQRECQKEDFCEVFMYYTE